MFQFLSAFAKSRKATIGFVMSVRPPAHPSVRMEQLGPNWIVFYKILYLRIFRKIVDKIQASLISDKNNKYLT
jgi:hypothetical protein